MGEGGFRANQPQNGGEWEGYPSAGIQAWRRGPRLPRRLRVEELGAGPALPRTKPHLRRQGGSQSQFRPTGHGLPCPGSSRGCTLVLMSHYFLNGALGGLSGTISAETSLEKKVFRR